MGFALLLVACTHTIEVAPDQVPDLARYSAGESVVVEQGDMEVEITEAHRPVIVVSRDYRCSIGELLRHRCDSIIEMPLEQMSVTPDGLVFTVTASMLASRHRTIEVPVNEVERARLRLRGYVPDDWQPRWGLGLTFAGPAVVGNLVGQWFPLESLAVEVGATPFTGMIGVHSGLRIRPFEFGRMRPFVGTWINFLAAFGADDGSSQNWSSTGIRLGVDLHLLSSRRWLLTLEVDLARPLLDNRELIDGISGQWIPWGGLSTSLLF